MYGLPLYYDFMVRELGWSRHQLRLDHAASVARVNARSPLKRLGTTDQVARMALFVASDDCDFTTGAAFNVDGGIVMG